MNITTATALIAAAVEAGTLTQAEGEAANAAIRQRVYYGMPMSPRDRASILRNRFGLTA